MFSRIRMPSYKYQPARRVFLKTWNIQNQLDFRKNRPRNYKNYDYSTKPQCKISPNEWIKLPIERITQETHDSKRFTLALPDGIDDNLNIPISSSFTLRGYDIFNNNEEVTKKYTPISDSIYNGYIEFVIKCYKDGKLTPYLFNLHEGDSIEIKGPNINKLQYPFANKANIGMIAGGTGITPMIQILKEMVLNEKYDTRFVDLLYANKSMDDYLCQVFFIICFIVEKFQEIDLNVFCDVGIEYLGRFDEFKVNNEG